MVKDDARLVDACWHTCFHDGDIAKVQSFLDQGVDINARAPCSGAAPLDSAIFGGHMDLVRYLIERGADITGEGYSDNTPLMAAANQNNPEAVELLLTEGADPNLASSVTGETALHASTAHAYADGMINCVRLLLAAGANPNVQAKSGVATDRYYRDTRLVGETPLHLAAAFGNEAMIRCLLDAGADASIRDAPGDSARTWFSRHRRNVPHIVVAREVGSLLAPDDGDS
ncbi:MAG: ankyrin repeat domain-containing protein [Gemmatimonadetes bacterium]|jgi:ankyrin repeat protein|nr:ankyrin repeat domain-containing protein [Gemmatimonadota bacterium]MBT4610293.1 ankyrin repeat domain-containing protein [Gemmatimonadota bacterium]MBT5055491.1 ankyrin repeat domain-containing protein [Gemmatimonadota bacterium]MBT5143370.1 ankyrin repeat domain-containing protein [Gemmatimonadota bacterium]MBT5586696.1 ankyrin repeat domain-containing protein [Gemmatimonadota bacterium]